jgi:aldehyde dehydrogenase (NAD+)
MTKLAPALLAGNTVVFKPAEPAPLTARILAEAASATDILDGVFNVVYGTSPVVGEAIAGHPNLRRRVYRRGREAARWSPGTA